MSDFYLAALQLAFCLSPMAIGIFITMKVFNIPDITTDGSYTLGATVSAVLMTANYPIVLVLPISIVAGALAGTATGLVHTKLKIDALLSGILVMTALYSVNLMIMGRSNIPLVNLKTIFSYLQWSNYEIYGQLIVAFIIAVVVLLLIMHLLKTDFGIAMRATGNNPVMTSALGINNDRIKIIGLAISNSLTALSGFLVAQYQGFADINMGIGIVITGLGSVLIADALRHWFHVKKISTQLLMVLVGALAFQSVLAFTLSIGVDPNMLKMVTAVFVLTIVALPKISTSFSKNRS